MLSGSMQVPASRSFRAMPIFAVGDYVQIKCRGGQLLEGVVCDLADVPPPGGAVTLATLSRWRPQLDRELKALWLAERCWRWEGDFHSRRFPHFRLRGHASGRVTLVKLRDATQEKNRRSGR